MDKNVLNFLNNILITPDGFETMRYILRMLGAFDRGLNRSASDREIYLTLGKREAGNHLLDLIFKANRKKYIEILEKERI